MSGFLDPIEAEDFEDGRRRKLLKAVRYHVGSPDSGDLIVVPSGFVTDGGSVPRPLWWYIDPWGQPSKAFLLHDWLYHTQLRHRMVADAILLEAMEVLKVNRFKRWIMFKVLEYFGSAAWDQHKTKCCHTDDRPKGGNQMTEPSDTIAGEGAAHVDSGDRRRISDEYSIAVAAKKAAWESGKLSAMTLLAPGLTPTVVQILTGINDWTAPRGVSLTIDPSLLEKSLAGGAFILLFILHDYLKQKTGWKFL